MKKSLFLSATCGFLLAGCCTAHHVTKWEYRQTGTITEVNQLAEQGWTVVNFTSPVAGAYVYLLRHPKP